jgi:cysteine synthase
MAASAVVCHNMQAAGRTALSEPDSILGAIGRTPLIALDRYTRGLDGRILLKLEYLNPGGSKKDRIARQLVLDAEASGELAPGQPVVELTSGNTGTGLAIVCAVTGHPFVAVMSEGNSAERARMMRALGAEVVLVPQAQAGSGGQVSGEDLDLVEQEAQRVTTERGAFRADQFRRASNARAHSETTGEELWADADGAIDAFVDFVGTGGTFAGVAAALRRHRPEVRCYVLEPAGAEALAGGAVSHPRHRIQGGGYVRQSLEQLDGVMVDGYLAIDDTTAIAAARRLAREEGVFGGFSTGACVAAAEALIRAEPGLRVACLAADSGMKYLSTDLWD